MNCWVRPAAIDTFAGVTEIEFKVGALTVKVAEPLMVPNLAVRVVTPSARLVASPLLFTLATVAAEELHFAVLVKFCVLPLLYVPVAVNSCVRPKATEGAEGVTEMEVKIAVVTVNVAEPLIVPEVALMAAVPGAIAVASPPLFTVATEVDDEFHRAEPVRLLVVPLLYVPVAVNCWLLPAGMEALDGETEIDVKTAAVIVSLAEPLIEPTLALIVAVPCATAPARPVLLTVATVAAEEDHCAELVKF